MRGMRPILLPSRDGPVFRCKTSQMSTDAEGASTMKLGQAWQRNLAMLAVGLAVIMHGGPSPALAHFKQRIDRARKVDRRVTLLNKFARAQDNGFEPSTRSALKQRLRDPLPALDGAQNGSRDLRMLRVIAQPERNVHQRLEDVVQVVSQTGEG